jgi:hypothetical protein
MQGVDVNILRTSILCLSLILSLVNLSSAKEWQGIVPLKSTRADVERLLGAPRGGVYHYRNEIVSVGYAQFPCGHKNPPGWPQAPPGWNVPPGTVVAIRVSLGNKPVPLSSLSLDLSKLKRVRGDDEVPQHFYYTNDEEGFAIECFDYGDDGGEMVRAYIYKPTAKEEEMFRCRE